MPGAQPGTLTLVQDGVLSPRSCKHGVGQSDLGTVHGVATRCRGIERNTVKGLLGSTSRSDVPSAGGKRTQACTQLVPAASAPRTGCRHRSCALWESSWRPNPILKDRCHRRHDLQHLKCSGLIFAFEPKESLRSAFLEACRAPEHPHNVCLFGREGHTQASHWTENNDGARAAAQQVRLLSRRHPHVSHEHSTLGPVTLAKMRNVFLKP